MPGIMTNYFYDSVLILEIAEDRSLVERRCPCAAADAIVSANAVIENVEALGAVLLVRGVELERAKRIEDLLKVLCDGGAFFLAVAGDSIEALALDLDSIIIVRKYAHVRVVTIENDTLLLEGTVFAVIGEFPTFQAIEFAVVHA